MVSTTMMVVIVVVMMACCFVSTTMALKCFQCGMYNDGVGSITPCINYTQNHLKECPESGHKFCIKYVSEGSVVRDCVSQCQEKELWGSKTFCCNQDGCNSSNKSQSMSFIMLVILSTLLPIVFNQKYYLQQFITTSTIVQQLLQ